MYRKDTTLKSDWPINNSIHTTSRVINNQNYFYSPDKIPERNLNGKTPNQIFFYGPKSKPDRNRDHDMPNQNCIESPEKKTDRNFFTGLNDKENKMKVELLIAMQENEKLKKSLKESKENCEELKEKLENSGKKIANFDSCLKNVMESIGFFKYSDNYTKMLKKVKNKIENEVNLRKELVLELNRLKSEKNDLNQNLQLSKNEIQKLNEENFKLKENEKVSSEIRKMIGLSEKSKLDSEDFFKIKQKLCSQILKGIENKKLADSIKNLQDEISKLKLYLIKKKTKIHKLESIINSFEGGFGMLRDNEQIKIKDIIFKAEEINNKSEEKMQKLIEKLETEAKIKQEKIQKEYELDIEKLKSQNSEILNKIENELNESKKKIKRLNNKLSRFEEVDEENRKNKEKIMKLENDLAKKNEDFTVNNEYYSTEIKKIKVSKARLNKKLEESLKKNKLDYDNIIEITDKLKMVELEKVEICKNYRELEKNLKYIQSEKNIIEEQLESLKSQPEPLNLIENLKNENQLLLNKIIDLNKLNVELNNEKLKLEEFLGIKENELKIEQENSRNEISKSADLIEKINELNTKLLNSLENQKKFKKIIKKLKSDLFINEKMNKDIISNFESEIKVNQERHEVRIYELENESKIQLESLNGKIIENEQEIEALKGIIQQNQNQNEDLKKRLQNYNNESDALKNEIQDKSNKIFNLEGEIKKLNFNFNQLGTNVKKLESEKKKISENFLKCKNGINKLEKEKIAIECEMKSQRDHGSDSNIHIDLLKKELDSYKQETKKLKKALIDQKLKSEELKRNNEINNNFESLYQKIKVEQDENSRISAELNIEKNNLIKKTEELKEEIKKLNENNNIRSKYFETCLKTAQKQYADLEKNNSLLNNMLIEIETKYNEEKNISLLKFNELLSKYRVSETEIETLKDIKKRKVSELKKLQSDLNIKHEQDCNKLKEKLSVFEQCYSDHKEELLKKNSKIRNLKQEIRVLRNN